MNPTDLQHLRTAIDIARQAREHVNHPFGALLVDKESNVLCKSKTLW
jgi:tRNA(Arg) A34 adenosine deaminase TadA